MPTRKRRRSSAKGPRPSRLKTTRPPRSYRSDRPGSTTDPEFLNLYDWATEKAMERLAEQKAFDNLPRHNLRCIAEYRAMRSSTAHWDQLGSREKFQEMASWRRLYSRLSHCLIEALLPYFKGPMPLSAMAATPNLEHQIRRAKLAARRDDLRKLSRKRDALLARISQLRRRRVR
jgi:hypothetical protein